MIGLSQKKYHHYHSLLSTTNYSGESKKGGGVTHPETSEIKFLAACLDILPTVSIA